MKAIIIGAWVVSSAASGASFMPDNQLWREDHLEAATGLSEAQFNAVIDQAERIYKPIVAQFGATLTVERRFADPTVNAFADQPSDTDWQVHMFGGLARRREVTEDGFAMVVCHELGHHLGGYPFVFDWAANEGQSDIHATGACASKVFSANPLLSAAALSSLPPKQKAACDTAHSSQRERDVCYRSVVAGKSLADLLASLEGSKVSFDTPDTSVVTKTNDEHPAAQCRLDTYVAGALCGNLFWNYALIPGKQFADRNGPAAQAEAFKHSCVSGVGARPKCWFAPVN